MVKKWLVPLTYQAIINRDRMESKRHSPLACRAWGGVAMTEPMTTKPTANPVANQVTKNTPAHNATKAPKVTKLQTLANALLAGERITGRAIINDFGINDFKTAIWKLRDKKGMPITTAMQKGDDCKYGLYFMTAQSIKEYCQNEGV